MNEIQQKDANIVHLEKIVDRLMPENPCRTSLRSGIHCMKPATHIYAGIDLCDDCAQNLKNNGANPPPVRFNFEAQTACPEIA
ncbi:MAG: hypothetical protein UR66_C0004G0084 [Candidatus Moranbacteria bacterium GW2011_GWE1_35_17]|nr:MAG: hypothetical protein UR66_C0004G0084 [Candidatus Moranbacteria bacterium GW2011_GWE1_35_17]KKP84653.1 MAG: hypothetical protein UR82_C0001G0020 [Candidatus Moranbacteria bacterium GW2011_GWF1_35_5]HBR79235.1 hypothetical protein [Candidatus Moranbacteria bacterium]